MTRIRFKSGREIDVDLGFDELAALVTRARTLDGQLEISAPDGRQLLVNPSEIETVSTTQAPESSPPVTLRLSSAH